ncbi:hypothetical protein [Thermomonas sp.]|uniref:hypothetical protein n=1 Tax=Thermomonas sp. TaxID=1971895 RepID=UPI0024873A11|nr:hypothetical protein [Thermomonas sp.]MDI1253479.1 hypothetical protein [Thermomonas sp.]
MAALKNKKISRKKHAAAIEPTVRHLWLASLGALVAVRRESKAVALRVAAGVEDAATRIRQAARNAEADLRGGIADVRGQVQPKMMKLSSDVEARLAPIIDKLGLDKFGLKAKTRRAPSKGRKPASKKPTLRRATRKPVKRAAKKVAS